MEHLKANNGEYNFSKKKKKKIKKILVTLEKKRRQEYRGLENR
jgi:hypothetical protein